MAKSLDELEEQFRRDIDDKAEPYLWSQEEFYEYIDEAQDEFVERTEAILDKIPLVYVTGDVFVDIPKYVTRIRSAKAPTGKSVVLYNDEQWDNAQISGDYSAVTLSTSWESKTGVEPVALVTDTKSDQVRLYPIPEQDGALTLRVFRRTLVPVSEAGELEIADSQHQRCIMLKVMALAYNKHDSETYRPNSSADFDNRFDEKVADIRQRVKRKRRRAGTVWYGGL